MIQVKRAYEQAAEGDGLRILVDRVWPRGISKSDAAIDIWLKDAAPSRQLRQWFGHDASRWEDFLGRYRRELQPKLGILRPLMDFLEDEHDTVTLVFGARDTEHNNAVALKEMLQE